MDALKRSAAEFWSGVTETPATLSNWAHTVDQGEFWSILAVAIVALAFVLARALR